MAQLPQRTSKLSSQPPTPQSGERAIISTEVATMIAEAPPTDRDSGPMADASMTTMVGSGTSFGHYRLERLIGRGGMASVYAAHRHDNGVRVAIKILQPDLLDDPTAMPRFMREGRMASTLKSPNSVRVLDVGVSNGLPFMVMELLEGESLYSFLASAPKERLSPQIALDLLAQTCSAVAEAHEAGIIHRDLTPGNLFLTKVRDEGATTDRLCVKVLDFGLAKPSYRPEADPTAISITQAGSCLGTPRYMAPEQILGARDVDARVDVWALGVCLYSMMTGHHPFEGDDKNATSIPMRVLAAKPTPPRVYRPDIAPAIEAIIMRCLAAKPNARFSNARELETAVRSQLLSRPSTPPSSRPVGVVPPKNPSKTRLIASRPSPASSSAPVPVAGSVLAGADLSPPSLGALVNATTGEPPNDPSSNFQEGTLVMPAALARVRPSRAPSSNPPPPPAGVVGSQVPQMQVQTAPQGMRPTQPQPQQMQQSQPPPPPPHSQYPSQPPAFQSSSYPVPDVANMNARRARSQATVRVRRRSGNYAMTIVLSLFLLFILCAAVAFVWARRGPDRHAATKTMIHSPI